MKGQGREDTLKQKNQEGSEEEDKTRAYGDKQLKLGVIWGIVWKHNTVETSYNTDIY